LLLSILSAPIRAIRGLIRIEFEGDLGNIWIVTPNEAFRFRLVTAVLMDQLGIDHRQLSVKY